MGRETQVIIIFQTSMNNIYKKELGFNDILCLEILGINMQNASNCSYSIFFKTYTSVTKNFSRQLFKYNSEIIWYALCCGIKRGKRASE